LALLAILLLSVPVRYALFTPDSFRIEDAIDSAYTSRDPEYCVDDVTETYMEQRYKVTSPYADDLCEEYSTQNRADSVDVSDIDIHGDYATAAVAVTGGNANGQVVEVQLVNQDGDWKVDRVVRNLVLNRGALVNAYAAQFARLGASAGEQACAGAAVRRLSEAELERMGLGSDPGPAGRIAVRCARPTVERTLLSRFQDPRFGNLPPAMGACVAAMIRGMSDAELAETIYDPASYGALRFRCDRGAMFNQIERQLEPYEGLGTLGATCVIDRIRDWPARMIVRLTYDEASYQRLIDHCRS
jgi:hypothetical protein